MNSWQQEDLQQLERAVRLLETPTLTIKLTNLVGTPVEHLLDKLPSGLQNKIHGVVTTSLYKVLDVAGASMNANALDASPRLHKLAAGASGALGGLFGITGLLVELPISTTVMMRAVLDIARSEGFAIDAPATRLACIEVFGFSGNTNRDDDAAESGYYMTRAALTQVTQAATAELAKMVAERGAKVALDTGFSFSMQTAGKAIATLIDVVATRLGIVLTEKSAAQLVPVLGAVTAATLNTMFTDFYQDMARGHFTVMRLEQKYGAESVKQQYARILAQGLNH